jgi:hypothetical protein
MTIMTQLVTTHPNDKKKLSAFSSPKPDFLGGHPSWYYSRRNTLNYGILIGSCPHCFKTRCVKREYTYKHILILISRQCGTS